MSRGLTRQVVAVARFLLLLAGVVFSAACDGVYRVVVPMCPISDSAKAVADSIPLGCPGTLPDSTGG